MELAEAMAEMVHKRVRGELAILRGESAEIDDIKMTGYHGCRYSFGYPSCPDLEMNRTLFRLLRPERITGLASPRPADSSGGLDKRHHRPSPMRSILRFR